MGGSTGDGVDLPEDVTVEILSRLPVKSLIRFNCISKYWHSLIKHPNFISKHLHHSKDFKNSRLLVYNYNHLKDANDFLLFPQESLKIPTYHHLYLSFPVFPLVFGPCNGILCLCNQRDRIALWNPATREFRALPFHRPDFPPNWTAWDHIIGFGLDPITNDYKLIWIRTFSDERKSGMESVHIKRVVVYTLSTNSWRDFEGDVPNYDLESGLYMNGVYYWFVRENGRDDFLLSFHLGEEEFGEVTGPPFSRRSANVSLASYNGLVCVIDCDFLDVIEQWVDVWVMVEQGCWMKQFSMGPFEGIEEVLGFWKNGEIFLGSSNGQVVLYDPDERVRKDFGPWGSHDPECRTYVNMYSKCLEVFIYSESLVSVKGGNNESREQEDSSFDMARFPEFFVRPSPKLGNWEWDDESDGDNNSDAEHVMAEDEEHIEVE